MIPAILGAARLALPVVARGARLVGSGLKGTRTLNSALAKDAVQVARNTRRGAIADAAKNLQTGQRINQTTRASIRQQNPIPTYQDAMANVLKSKPTFVDQAGYQVGRGLRTVSTPFGGPAGLGMTAAFMAPGIMLPQQSPYPEPQMGYAPFDNAYTQMPMPQSGMLPVDQRTSEAYGAAQIMGPANQLQPLTDEQIVKARRRNEEQAQLYQIYANTLSQYEMQ